MARVAIARGTALTPRVVRLLASAAAALLMAAAAAGPAASQVSPGDPGWLLVSRGQVGPFEVGMTVDQVHRVLGRERVRLVPIYDEGMFAPLVELRLSESHPLPALTAPIREWPCPPFRLASIWVHSPAYRTAEGLGVGSTLEEVRGAYSVEMLWGHAGHIARVEALDLGFVFAVADLEPGSVVTSMFLNLPPAEMRRRHCGRGR